MKFKKLTVVATAAVMATSVVVPAVTATSATVEANQYTSDINTIANRIRFEDTLAAVQLGIKAAEVTNKAYHVYKKASKADKYKQNHSQFHLKKNKVYLILKNGKKAGKKYYLRKGTKIYVQSWVVPKKTYKVKGMKCYKVGKTTSGKTLYLPVKYTAYTHVKD